VVDSAAARPSQASVRALTGAFDCEDSAWSSPLERPLRVPGKPACREPAAEAPSCCTWATGGGGTRTSRSRALPAAAPELGQRVNTSQLLLRERSDLRGA
jgi:hypothetical protein